MREVSFQEAVGKKYPEQVVMITTVDAEGCPDVMPAGWSMVASGVPPMLAVSVGHTRHTHKLLKERGEFVVALPTVGMEDAIFYCGSYSGKAKDKFARPDVNAVAAKMVAPPLLAGCAANFECKLVGQLEAGDHTIFVGEVVASHVDDKAGPRILNFGTPGFGAAQIVPSE